MLEQGLPAVRLLHMTLHRGCICSCCMAATLCLMSMLMMQADEAAA